MLTVPNTKIDLANKANYSDRKPGAVIDTIVLHWTGAETASSTINWFKNPAAKSSAHALIDKDGTIIYMVPENKKAWHAGVSSWNGRKNVNEFSLGIEIVGTDAKFTDAQYNSIAYQCAVWCSQFKIKGRDIVGHNTISPGRKLDIIGFEWERFHSLLNERQGKHADPEPVDITHKTTVPLTVVDEKSMSRTPGKDPTFVEKMLVFINKLLRKA